MVRKKYCKSNIECLDFSQYTGRYVYMFPSIFFYTHTKIFSIVNGKWVTFTLQDNEILYLIYNRPRSHSYRD